MAAVAGFLSSTHVPHPRPTTYGSGCCLDPWSLPLTPQWYRPSAVTVVSGATSRVAAYCMLRGVDFWYCTSNVLLVCPAFARFTAGEDGERAKPETVDVARLVSGLRNTVSADEVTLDGMRSVNTTATRQRFPATVPDRGHPTVDEPVTADGAVTVTPFELRTFRMT